MNLISVTVNRKTTADEMNLQKKYYDVELNKNTISRFIQALENYLEVSAENDVDNLSKDVKIQITDTRILKAPNTAGYLLQNWNKKCNDKKNGTTQNIKESAKQAL